MFTLSPDQQDALDDVLDFLAIPEPGEIALSGPAGTGKTVLTRFILEEARGGANFRMAKLLYGTNKNNQQEFQIALCSSTNKAATVLSQATGEDVQTIHSLLGLTVKNDYKTGQTRAVKTKRTTVITNTFIIIDEASMINADLLRTIRDCTQNCKVLYIGDSYQLAPVMENTSPVFIQIKDQLRLTTIQRQAATNPIIAFAGQFRSALDDGIFPIIESHGSKIMHMNDADFEQAIKQAFKDPVILDLDNNHVTDDLDKIISWSNIRVHEYNNYIRALHDPDPAPQAEEYLITNAAVIYNNQRVFKGDTIVRVASVIDGEYLNVPGYQMEITNGRRTAIVFMAKNPNQVAALLKEYAKQKNWAEYFKYKDEFVDLRPYYASTINKAQGSTYKNVFIDVGDIGRNKKNTEIARLMYTAITRATNNVYLRGTLPARLYNDNNKVPVQSSSYGKL